MADFLTELANKYPFTKDCKLLSDQIDLLIIEEDLRRKSFDVKGADIVHNYLAGKKNWFKVYKCEVALSEDKAKIVNTLIEDYSDVDQQRINERTKKDIMQRMVLGVVVLSIALFIIIKKK